MLSAEQVIPFLASDDSIVRDHATRYFADFSDEPVPLSAEICWAAIDRIGLCLDAEQLIFLLQRTRQSDASTLGLLTALDRPSRPKTRDHLFDALGNINFEQLTLHRKQILARPDLPEKVRYHILDRLELVDTPAEAIWQRLDEHARQVNELYWNEIDRSISARLVEALARHGQTSAERALAILNDPASKGHAREIFAIGVLAGMRHRPALELVLDRFITSHDDEDVLHEVVQDALPSIGGLDLIPVLQAAYPDQSWTFQLYASTSFARLRHPDAEAALIQLLNDPRVEQASEDLASALFDLCATSALPQLAALVLSGKCENRIIDLEEDLVACSLMTGFDFPELSALREVVVARDAEFRRKVESGEFGRAFDDLDDFDDDEDEEDYEDDEDEYPDDNDFDSFELPFPPQTIVNQQPKIGRNDPCPCGSGKKYKKCCLNK